MYPVFYIVPSTDGGLEIGLAVYSVETRACELNPVKKRLQCRTRNKVHFEIAVFVSYFLYSMDKEQHTILRMSSESPSTHKSTHKFCIHAISKQGLYL
jgi:hypothetical protein